MTLPEWNLEGLLPPGGHAADWGGIYGRLVEGAPDRARREHLFGLLQSYSEVAFAVFGPSLLLVGGGFVTRQLDHVGVEAVLLPNDYGAQRPTDDRSMARAQFLLTQRSVIVGEPHYAAHTNVRPFADSLDGFLGHVNNIIFWRTKMSRVTDAQGNPVHNTKKGYVEVSL